jgi:hypothetical protein
MPTNASGLTAAEVLVDDWCQQLLQELCSFLAYVKPTARPCIEPVIENVLLVLDPVLTTTRGCQLPTDADR